MKIRQICGQAGQSVIEYSLILGVVAVMVVSILTKVRGYMIGDGPCPNDSFLCTVIRASGGQANIDGAFRLFKLRR